MAEPEDAVPRGAFLALASRLSGCESLAEVHQVVVEHAVRLVDGADHAVISVLERGRMRTTATSDEVGAQLEALQRETGEGPCLDAITEVAWEYVPDLQAEDTAGVFPRLVRERTPVRSMLAFRMVDDGRKRGSLNLFADRPHAFTMEAAEEAAMLAALATVATAGAARAQRGRELAEAVETNRHIGAAIGILMASRSIGSDEAFQRLRRASQAVNRKLRFVAAEVVARQEGRAGGGVAGAAGEAPGAVEGEPDG